MTDTPAPQTDDDDRTKTVRTSNLLTDLSKDQLKPPHPDRNTGFERILTDPPPPWFVELYPGGDGRGFLQKLDHHSVIFHDRSPQRLVISFDNLANTNDHSFAREPWAWKFTRDMGWSHLGILSRKKAWYRDQEIIDYMEARAAEGFFRRFDEVVLTGTSMGAFAALAFSTLIKDPIVVAFNPQSTLDERLVPWEERYQFGRMQDWTLPYSDTVDASQMAKRLYVLYDPFFEPDRRHAERLDGPNTVYLKTWFSNHFSAVLLRKLGILKPLMQSLLQGTLEADEFYKIYRVRRTLPWHMRALTEQASQKHPDLLKQARRRFRELRQRATDEANSGAS